MCFALRRAFRRNHFMSHVSFCMAPTLDDAMAPFRRCFHPPLVHVDLLERLRGQYQALRTGTNLWSNAATGFPLAGKSVGASEGGISGEPGSASESRVRFHASGLLHPARANLRYEQAADEPTAGRNPTGTATEENDSRSSTADDDDSDSTQEGGNVLEVRTAMTALSRRPLPSPPNSRQPWHSHSPGPGD
jgi:hypothetical protein